jgi:hypothetical protein
MAFYPSFSLHKNLLRRFIRRFSRISGVWEFYADFWLHKKLACVEKTSIMSLEHPFFAASPQRVVVVARPDWNSPCHQYTSETLAMQFKEGT